MFSSRTSLPPSIYYAHFEHIKGQKKTHILIVTIR
jgi:hypothetical protein